MTRRIVSWLSMAGVLAGLLVAAGCLHFFSLTSEDRNSGGPRTLEANEYEVPAGADAETLLAFLEHLYNREPSLDELIRYPTYSRRVLDACNKAADRILECAQSDAAQRLRAVEYKCRIYSSAQGLGHAALTDTRDHFLDMIRRDDDPQIALVGTREYLRCRSCCWFDLSDADQRALVDELTNFVQTAPLEDRDFEMAAHVASQLELAGQLERARHLYAALIPALKQHGTPAASGDACAFEARLRRLSLIGKEMVLHGVLLGGGDLAWSTYRGKVVLVNFWASYCDACESQIPMLKRAYENYHGRGFEVLTVNLDRAQTADAFVARNAIPWDVLFCDEKGDIGCNQSVVTHYGIWHLPASILIDRDGKVVALSTHGSELETHLQAVFGDAA